LISGNTDVSVRSPVLRPDLESGNPPYLALESFGKRPRYPAILLCDKSPDPALNFDTRPLSVPDRKSSLGKGRGGIAQSTSRRKSGFFRFVFWGWCPGCNPPSVLSSICQFGNPSLPAKVQWRLITGRLRFRLPVPRLSPG